jgi:hypothetical protein
MCAEMEVKQKFLLRIEEVEALHLRGRQDTEEVISNEAT